MPYKITDTIILDQNKNISNIGIASFSGPLIVGGGTSTGTSLQALQITGNAGAYIGGNLGIGNTNPTAKVSVTGNANISGILTSTILSASKDPGTGVLTNYTNSSFGNGWVSNSPASTTYYRLAILPVGNSGNTFDHIQITGVLGAWTNDNQTPFDIIFSNRNSFDFKYISYGSIRSDVRIIGVSLNNTIEVWAQHQAFAFTKLVYNIDHSIGVTVFTNPSSTTIVPSGVVVFDSSTNLPRFIINENDNIGIGTASPTQKLDISGNVKATTFIGSGSSITGVPISTGISGLGANVATFLATPTSSNLALAITNETGTAGNLVFSNGPTISNANLTTPKLGVATASSLDVIGIVTFRSAISDKNGQVGSANSILTADGASGWSWKPITAVGAIGGISVIDDSFGLRYPVFAADSTSSTAEVYVDKSNIVYNTSNNRLGIGSLTPTTTLDIVGNTKLTGSLSFLNAFDLFSATLTTSSTSQATLSSISAATYTTIEYTIQAVRGTNIHTTKILLIEDGTTASITEYGTITNGIILATYDADVSGGNVRLLVTPNSATSTKFQVAITAIHT